MKLPDFEYEKRVWRKGFRFVSGADEVGRGALAGPIVAGAVVWYVRSARPLEEIQKVEINDSKKLSAQRREKLAKLIKENALAWGVGEVSVAFINKHGIVRAMRAAFRKAIADCNRKLEVEGGKADFLLVDAFYVPYTKGLRRKNQLAIIKGDEKSISIAAASIVAKVYRDELMRKLSRKHRKYKWNANKGYGTRRHIEAIKKHGVTRLHRKAFVRKLTS